MSAKIIKQQLLFIDNNESVFLKKDKLVFSNSRGEFFVKIPCNPVIARFSLLRRMFRYDIRCISKIRNRYFFFFKGKLYLIDQDYKLNVLKEFSSMSSPLYFCKSADELFIYFGDYSNQKQNLPVNLYKLDYDGNIEIVSSFNPGSVKHIHNIIKSYDKFYILTGDDDDESGIWKFENDSIEQICVGKQEYRSCFLWENNKKLFYFTDSPMSQNHILCLDLTKNSINIVKNINGPCINAVEGNKCIYFVTSVEPNPNRKNIFNNYLVSKYIYDKYVHVFRYVFDKNEIEEVYRFKKDHHNMKYFGLGNARLLLDNNSLYIVPFGNSKLYGKTILIDTGK